jgi:hypothetical protein
MSMQCKNFFCFKSRGKFFLDIETNCPHCKHPLSVSGQGLQKNLTNIEAFTKWFVFKEVSTDHILRDLGAIANKILINGVSLLILEPSVVTTQRKPGGFIAEGQPLVWQNSGGISDKDYVSQILHNMQQKQILLTYHQALWMQDFCNNISVFTNPLQTYLVAVLSRIHEGNLSILFRDYRDFHKDHETFIHVSIKENEINILFSCKLICYFMDSGEQYLLPYTLHMNISYLGIWQIKSARVNFNGEKIASQDWNSLVEVLNEAFSWKQPEERRRVSVASLCPAASPCEWPPASSASASPSPLTASLGPAASLPTFMQKTSDASQWPLASSTPFVRCPELAEFESIMHDMNIDRKIMRLLFLLAKFKTIYTEKSKCSSLEEELDKYELCLDQIEALESFYTQMRPEFGLNRKMEITMQKNQEWHILFQFRDS